MAALNRFMWCAGMACVLTGSLIGCGGGAGGTGAVASNDDESGSSGLPTMALPGLKGTASKTTKAGAGPAVATPKGTAPTQQAVPQTPPAAKVP